MIMRVGQTNNYGINSLEVTDTDIPKVSEGKILVAVKSACINPFDLAVVSGVHKDKMPVTFPYVPGGDFSGVIKEIGEGATGLKVGDEVYGSANIFSGGSGSMAEFAVARAKNTALKPKNTTFAAAAALPLVGSSVVQALEEHLNLKNGDRILVHGGAGGIGHLAIQLAKVIGAYVITSVSADDREFVKRLGADEIVDYKTEKFEEKLKDLDAVFDTVGSEVTNKSLSVLKSGGVLLTMSGNPDPELSKKYNVRVIRQVTKTNTTHLERLTQLVEAGKIKVNIDRIFSLDEIKEAFSYQKEKHPNGKVVVKIKE